MGLSFPPMNGRAGTKKLPWSGGVWAGQGPEADPDTSRALDVAAPAPGSCGPVIVRCLLVQLAASWRVGRMRESLVEAPFLHLMGGTGHAGRSSSWMSHHLPGAGGGR